MGEKIPLVIFNANYGRLLASNGCLKVHNSYRTTPKLHMSAFWVYGLLSIISGDK